MKIYLLFIAFILPVFSHQPILTANSVTEVLNPNISKAYYSTLETRPQIYKISSKKPFDLYVNILVPNIKDQKTSLFVEVIKKEKSNIPLSFLNGQTFNWTKFFEPFANDTYLMGPAFKRKVAKGEYEIKVSSPIHNIKYVLAIGELERFRFKETYKTINTVLEIKKSFFNKSPATFLFSIFGSIYILTIIILSFVFGFTYRYLLKKFAKSKLRKLSKNINNSGRIIRFFIGVILFLIGIFTSWNPLYFFFSGFCFYEAIFSWCGVFAAVKKCSI